MADKEWGDADFERYGSELENFTPDMNLLDAAISGAQEAWEYNPMQSLRHHFSSKSGVQSLNAQEANEKYGLEDSKFAFKGDAKVSEEHARRVGMLNVEAQQRDAIDEHLNSEYGFLQSSTKFLGSLSAGLLDPINLGTGIGLGMASKYVASAASSGSLLRAITAGTNTSQFIANKVGENFIASVAVDGFLTPLGEEAVNIDYGIEQRIFNIMAGTVLGSVMDTALSAKHLASLRANSNNTAKQFGGQAEEVIQRSMEHGIANVGEGKKPNPDYIVNRMEMEHYHTRPDQKPYESMELDSTNIEKASWFSGVKEDGTYDAISSRGSEAIVLTDNFNYAHNRLASLDGKTKGRVHHLEIKKDAKILTNDKFIEVKPLLRKAFKASQEGKLMTKLRKSMTNREQNLLNAALADAEDGAEILIKQKALGKKLNKHGLATNLEKGFLISEGSVKNLKKGTAMDTAESNLLKKIDDVITESADVTEIKERLHQSIEDPSALRSVDDIVNDALREAGYDGYHFKQSAATLDGMDYNGLVLFKRVQEAPKMTVTNSVSTTKFDPNHPKAKEFGEAFKKVDLEENNRLRGTSSNRRYSEEADGEMQKVPEADLEGFTPEAILEGQFDLEGLADQEFVVPLGKDGKVDEEFANFKYHLNVKKNMEKIEKMTGLIQNCLTRKGGK